MVENERSAQPEKAILVGVSRPGEGSWEIDDSLDELQLLADTAGAIVTDRVVQSLDRINPATYVGKGKVQEIKGLVKMRDADPMLLIERMKENTSGIPGFRFFHDHDPRVFEAAIDEIDNENEFRDSQVAGNLLPFLRRILSHTSDEQLMLIAGVMFDMASLMLDDERRRALGERARGVVERNRGAVEKTVEALADLIE